MNDKQPIGATKAFSAMIFGGIGGAMIMAALAYIVSPVDAIPDVIPVVGWSDDGGAMAFIVALLYTLQKTGVLGNVFAVYRELRDDMDQTIDKVLEEINK